MNTPSDVVMHTGPASRLFVTESMPGTRLDVYLRARFPHCSRGTMQRLIETHHVLVNGRPVKPTHRPRAGECIDIRWPAPTPAETQPEAIPLEVLHEDTSFLVVNKRPGMVVHPAAGHEGQTLVNALLHHCAGKLSGIGGVARPGIVHRLDKETSGCLVVAKNDTAHLKLAKQFAERITKKTYLALVCGDPQVEEGEIRIAIARHPTHRKRMAVTEGQGRMAATGYRVLEHLRHTACIVAHPWTGRTHQIRVHLKHLGHPLAGDMLYGNRQNKALQELTGHTVPRLMLHASELAFHHPETGRLVSFQAPVPDDFRETLNRFRAVAEPDHSGKVKT